jgi:flavin reductase (DIM6/NTAB) family NADH-FMN oxidoreductase RutF
MNAAWGGIYDTNQIMICLDHSHKTTDNIKDVQAFSVSIGDKYNVDKCDYVGIISLKKDKDKIKKSGFTFEKSEFVNAPIIKELKMTLECKLNKFNEDGIVVGDIVNVSIDDSVLTNDKLDLNKLAPITFDPINNKYVVIGENVGNAFKDGMKLK